MAGVSDLPFREVCRSQGAALAVSEMVTSRLDLHHSTKTRFRLKHQGESGLRSVQIVGTEPQQLAAAAQFNVEHGAQIIDINMGCPAKKVCKKAAGSALLAEPALIAEILAAVVSSVDVPVTLKIRTGTSPEQRNGVEIAKIAEQSGVAALAIHGRTRACKFAGSAEYDTIAAIKQNTQLPIIANGDINSPQKALLVLEATGADALMIGRAAQGQPWLFSEIKAYLDNGKLPEPTNRQNKTELIMSHISAIHEFYGARLGIKFARKHIKWYLQKLNCQISTDELRQLTTTECPARQLQMLEMALAIPEAQLRSALAA